MSAHRWSRLASVRLIVGATALVSLVVIGGTTALSGCGSDAPIPIDGVDSGDEESSVDSSIPKADGTTDTSVPTDTGTGVDGSSDVTDAGNPACADASPDAEVDCTGKCGPVKDLCTGKVKACGGCSPVGGDPRVCDNATNRCIEPLRTCGDLGAECGTVRNSCGDYLDCPTGNPKGCAAGKECDHDTHKCRDCQAVTCQDLGFECGNAWLGCGPDTPANATDCGGCAPDADGGTRVCNAVFNKCEPSCTPKTAVELCNAKKLSRGLECGIISNGCGGTVNCDNVPGFGCAQGDSCGVRGIANRCDAKSAPEECTALGQNCGTITSVCGVTKSCGDCPAGQVCNANKVCGPVCTPKTCANFVPVPFQCGTFDDGCGGPLTCGTCASGVCNDATKTCQASCTPTTCGATYPSSCGLDLPNGCGQNVLDCTCAGGTCTLDGGAAPAPPTQGTGACCSPIDYAAQGLCGTLLPNGCGGVMNVSCGANRDCVVDANGATPPNGVPGPAPANGIPGTCCTRNTCPPGICGSVQNACRPPGQGSPQTISCNTCSSFPDGGAGSPQTQCVGNQCCTPAAQCPGNGGENAQCNTFYTSPDCGSQRNCTCGGGRVCMCGAAPCAGAPTQGPGGGGLCKTALTCNSPGYAGGCGTALSNGVGGTIPTCGCPNGQVCTTSTPGQVGSCQCNTPNGQPYTCATVPNGPGQPGGDACGTFNNGCGGTIPCGCSVPGQVCNAAANPNVCCAPASCPAVPALGSACGMVTNGCTTVGPCGCPSGAANANFTCTGGVCACTADTCRGRTGPQPDLCGGTLQCGG